MAFESIQNVKFDKIRKTMLLPMAGVFLFTGLSGFDFIKELHPGWKLGIGLALIIILSW